MMVALRVVHRVIHNIRGYERFFYLEGHVQNVVVYRGLAAKLRGSSGRLSLMADHFLVNRRWHGTGGQ